jgi:hypothetical protein
MKRSLVLHTSMRPRSIASGGNRMSTSPLKSRFRWKATLLRTSPPKGLYDEAIESIVFSRSLWLVAEAFRPIFALRTHVRPFAWNDPLDAGAKGTAALV